MSVYYPEATPSLGTTKVKILTALADPAAPSLATEVNAATSYDATLTFRDWNPQMSPNSGQAPPRLGTKAQMPVEGRTQYQGIEVRYPYDPQADDTDPDNEAKAALVSGTVVTILERRGPDAELDDFAVADRTVAWKVRCGRQNKTRSGDDDFAEHEIVQTVYPLEPEVEGVIVA